MKHDASAANHLSPRRVSSARGWRERWLATSSSSYVDGRRETEVGADVSRSGEFARRGGSWFEAVVGGRDGASGSPLPLRVDRHLTESRERGGATTRRVAAQPCGSASAVFDALPVEVAECRFEPVAAAEGQSGAGAGALYMDPAGSGVGLIDFRGFLRANVPGGITRSEKMSGRFAASAAGLPVHSRPSISARRVAGSPGCVCHCWGGVAGSPSASNDFPREQNLRRRSIRGECPSPLGVNSNTGRGGARLESGPLRRPTPSPRGRGW